MAEERGPRGIDEEGTRPDASMTLLRQIMERPRDGAYADVAQRRAQGELKRSWFQEIIVLLLTIAIGTGGVWAARQLRAPVDSAIEARVVLEEQIQERSSLTESLREDIQALRSEIGEFEAKSSSSISDGLARQAVYTEIHAGTRAVHGPGVEVVLTEPAQPGSPEEHVLDVDLQIVANSLWSVGAEAVSINGRRLAFGTAIRTAGEVILVDLEPVQSPYHVTAIGDPDRLLRSFSETSGAEHLGLLNSNYRIKSSITQRSRIEMSAGNALKLEYAEAGTSADTLGIMGEERDTL